MGELTMNQLIGSVSRFECLVCHIGTSTEICYSCTVKGFCRIGDEIYIIGSDDDYSDIDGAE
jgi:hypothetical protein